ncbi:hypothetical protein NOR_04915 [Metarhizium rileyi]|uniref:Uncharacterized protein n=1 Tax=Metarhizium rileyi (strain RCEF 4871) TaxID=1649241 RepID=A0A167D8D1_METRR|nr:hypothetical protein NOR_04915 [Metarhizium rileyi RCEF 4871]
MACFGDELVHNVSELCAIPAHEMSMTLASVSHLEPEATDVLSLQLTDVDNDGFDTS